MRMRSLCAGLMVVLGLVSAPRTASADWLLTPFAGVAFGGDVDDSTGTYGVSIGYMGAGIVGFEIDFGMTPDFLDVDLFDIDISDTSVTTVMGNVIVGIPVGGTTGGGARPYFSAGAGLIRHSVQTFDDIFGDIDSNDFGINVGGGVMGFFNDRIGIRGDIRYFRSLQDEDPDGDDVDFGFGEFDFWRATGGVVIRF